MTLQGKTYCISDSYVASQEDIFDIFRILQVLKKKIVTFVDTV